MNHPTETESVAAATEVMQEVEALKATVQELAKVITATARTEEWTKVQHTQGPTPPPATSPP